MKQILFLLVIFLICSNELLGQQDNIPVSDSLKVKPTDSIYFSTITVLTDTSYGRREFPWGYPPPCIIPMKWDTISLRSLYWITPTITFILPYNAKTAKEAIKAGKPSILFLGKSGKISLFNSNKDKEFQAKYQIEFLSQEYIYDGTDEKAYNQVVFDYLDKKFGNTWRFELREDAIGFEAPELVIPKLGVIAMQIANSANPLRTESMNLDPETSVWWYVLPTSGFALLLSLYFIVKRKKKD